MSNSENETKKLNEEVVLEELDFFKRYAQVCNELFVAKTEETKSQNAKFNYNFRTAERILAIAKPICEKHDLLLLVDTVANMQSTETDFVSVIVRLRDLRSVTQSRQATFSTRVDNERKGMTIEQAFGRASSYAKKYALQDLFALSDASDDLDFQEIQRKDSLATLKEKISTSNAEERDICLYYGVDSLENLPKDKVTFLLNNPIDKEVMLGNLRKILIDFCTEKQIPETYVCGIGSVNSINDYPLDYLVNFLSHKEQLLEQYKKTLQPVENTTNTENTTNEV